MQCLIAWTELDRDEYSHKMLEQMDTKTGFAHPTWIAWLLLTWQQ